MDENDKAKLESAQRELEKYLQHPYTQRIATENATAQDTLLRLIINDDVRDVETLVAHFVAIGHLRGLRQSSDSLNETLAAIKEELAQ
jgi:hypothetical protein